MEIYWTDQSGAAGPRRDPGAAFGGANFIHRYLWKYQAWLQGYNGGPMRQPVMKLNDRADAAGARGSGEVRLLA